MTMLPLTKIYGVADLLKTMEALPNSMQNKALRGAMKAGANILAKAAADNVRAIVSDKSTGVLARNIRVYTLSKVNGSIRMGVMIRKGAVNPAKRDGRGAPVSVGLYGSVLEYRPGMSWLRKAAREEAGHVLATIEQELRINVDAAIVDAKR